MGRSAPGVQMNREHRSGVGFGDRDPRLRARMTAAQAQLTLDAGQRSADADHRAAKRDQMASCPDRTAFTPARDQRTESAPARGSGAHMMVVAVDVRPPAPAPKGPLARFVDRVLNLGPVRWLIPIIDAYDVAGGVSWHPVSPLVRSSRSCPRSS